WRWFRYARRIVDKSRNLRECPRVYRIRTLNREYHMDNISGQAHDRILKTITNHFFDDKVSERVHEVFWIIKYPPGRNPSFVDLRHVDQMHFVCSAGRLCTSRLILQLTHTAARSKNDCNELRDAKLLDELR